MKQGTTKRESITNRAAMKKFILLKAGSVRAGWKCERVSAQALDQIEAFVRNKVIQSIKSHPSVGKTFMNFY